jgi:hypothetical protein
MGDAVQGARDVIRSDVICLQSTASAWTSSRAACAAPPGERSWRHWNHGIELDPIPEPQRRTLKLYLYSRILEAR